MSLISGPLPLKHSLTNGEHPFEKECIDLFHFQEVDVGSPVSFSITIEPHGSLEGSLRVIGSLLL